VVVQRTSVGLDVHARSVVASALDAVTGEVSERRVSEVIGASGSDDFHEDGSDDEAATTGQSVQS
jgi:hypothetical protein